MALKVIMALIAASALVSSVTILESVNYAVTELCVSLTSLLPVVAMLMIVIAGVIYAAGQMMGAETRARANVWATSCLTGALIAVLIYAIVPPILSTIYGEGAVECKLDSL